MLRGTSRHLHWRLTPPHPETSLRVLYSTDYWARDVTESPQARPVVLRQGGTRQELGLLNTQFLPEDGVSLCHLRGNACAKPPQPQNDEAQGQMQIGEN